MPRVLVAGDSMVKYVDQYFTSRRGLAVDVAAHKGIRIEHLLSMIADKLAGFDVVIVHVGTNNGNESVSAYMAKYRQLARGIIESNPGVHVSFSAILPRGQNQFCPRENESSQLRSANERYMQVNAALRELCRERGFTFLDGLEDVWPSCLSRDGVHASRRGNEVLADFLYREACCLAARVERSRIQISYQESRTSSSWSGWTKQDESPIFCQAEFPPLESHVSVSSQLASGSCTTPAPSGRTRVASSQRRDTGQLPAGFALVGGVRVRCEKSMTWCTWDTFPSPVSHSMSVPARGKVDERLESQVPASKPVTLNRGASTTRDRVTGAASQEGACNPGCCSVEGEAGTPALAVAEGGACATPAPVWVTRIAPSQRRDTGQLPAGFALVGGVRVRCKGSKTWCTWDTFASPVSHGMSVPAKGKVDERLEGQVPASKPVTLNRGASTTRDRVTGAASQEGACNPGCCSVEEEASTPAVAVTKAVCQAGGSEWKLVLSKKNRRKAAAMCRQEQSFDLATGRKSGVRATARAKPMKRIPPMSVFVSKAQKGPKSDFCEPTSSTDLGGIRQSGANTSRGITLGSSCATQRVANQQKGMSLVATAAAANHRAALSNAVSGVTGCKSRAMEAVQGLATSKSGTAAGGSAKAEHNAAKLCSLAALMPCCKAASSDVQAACGQEGNTGLCATVGGPGEARCNVVRQCRRCVPVLTPGFEIASSDAQATVGMHGGKAVQVLSGGGCGKISLNATFDNFLLFKESFDAWCQEGKHVVSTSDSRRNHMPGSDEEFKYLRIVYTCVHGSNVRPRGTGERPHQKYNSNGCNMQLVVTLRTAPTLHYQVTKLNDAHSHQLDFYELYPQQRRLDESIQALVFRLHEVGAPTRIIREEVKKITGQSITTKDINNIMKKYSIPVGSDEAHGEMVLDKLERLVQVDPDCLVHYETNQSKELQFVLVQTAHMRNVLKDYHELLFVDGTYNVNVEGYVLYSILVEDSSGHGRSACYAFLKNETKEIVRAMFLKFIDLNPFVKSACKVVMIDKDLNELRILRGLLPNSTLLLCSWHVVRCLEKQANEKSRMQYKDLQPLIKVLVHSYDEQEYLHNYAKLKNTASKEFCSYYNQNWHSCKELWVHAYRHRLPTLGNDTNNRIESHNQKLKAYLESRLHLVDALQALLKYISNDRMSLEFAKFEEMKLSIDVTAMDQFELEMSRHCTSEAVTKLREEYSKFKAVQYVVTLNANLYLVAFGNKEHNVQQNLCSCTCTFHHQYMLPCAHIFAARRFAQVDIFDKTCIPNRWRKDHFLSTGCTTSSTMPLVTSSIQPPPSVKLDTAQEKYCYAHKALCEMSKALANVLANCGTTEIMEKLSSCQAFFRNITTFAGNQTAINLPGAPTQPQPQVKQVPAANSGSTSVTTKLKIPLVKARRGRPKKVRTRKRAVLPLQNKQISLAMIKSDVLEEYKKLSLCDKDLNAVASGTSVSDSVINVAQLLISKKFCGLSGFQDVLYGQGLRFSQVRGTFAQILHTRNPDHWLTVTNAGAPVDTVFVYDSIDQTVPSDAVSQICNMLKLQSPKLSIHVKPAQNQGTTLDCGLFAVANMYCIAGGQDPSHLHLNQGMLRSHLLKCIQKGVIDNFPLVHFATVRVKPKQYTYDLQCVCRQPLTNKVATDVECAVCSKIYHSACLGSVASKLNDKYLLCSPSCHDTAKERLQCLKA